MHIHHLQCLVLVATFLGLISHVVSQAPIPNRQPGFVYRTGNAPVLLEAWVDLVCPDAQAGWPTYLEVADHYGPDAVQFSALMFPLPYHRAAMASAKASFIADELNSTLTFDFFQNSFDKQEALYASNILDQPETYIFETYATWAGEVGYDRTEFLRRLSDREDPARRQAIVEFKYGGTRGVFGTPQTYVNGALVYSDPHTWTLESWKEVIDPLLDSNSAIKLCGGLVVAVLSTLISSLVI
ncbi:uncharacterized protein [Diadema setosum]|uniref:uncharacterized protein n=1 Tax=Diadema setosum TaxID=31175 RepID=UPI003B3A3B23